MIYVAGLAKSNEGALWINTQKTNLSKSKINQCHGHFCDLRQPGDQWPGSSAHHLNDCLYFALNIPATFEG
jgi:hypothetical protein